MMVGTTNGLRRLRERKLMTQRELAEAIGIRQPSISDWELGLLRPNNASKRKLCEVLGVTVDELLAALDERSGS